MDFCPNLSYYGNVSHESDEDAESKGIDDNFVLTQSTNIKEQHASSNISTETKSAKSKNDAEHSEDSTFAKKSKIEFQPTSLICPICIITFSNEQTFLRHAVEDHFWQQITTELEKWSVGNGRKCKICFQKFEYHQFIIQHYLGSFHLRFPKIG